MGPAPIVDETPVPQSMQEVEHLIQTLYSPGTTPQEVQAINRTLQALQRSPEGWLLANTLSSSSNEHTQFFAASTWMVKLNTDWQSLSEQDAVGLLDSLITWLIRIVEAGYKPYIWRKICITLVTYYIRFIDLWQPCIRHLVCRFAGVTSGVHLDSLQNLPATDALVAQLPSKVKTVLVGFTRTLVEETSKIDSKNIKGFQYHDGMILNAPDAVGVVMRLLTEHGSPLSQLTVDQVNLVEESLNCYQSWATYSTRETRAIMPLFQPVTRVVFEWLESPQVYRLAASTVTEMLTSVYFFYTEADKNFLAERITSAWGQKKYSQIVPKEHDDYDSEETDAFAHLLVAFAESNMEMLARAADSPGSTTIFEMMHGLLRIEGHPVVDEEVSTLEFEFWSSLTEFINDWVPEEGAEKPRWLDICKGHLLRAVQAYWVKIKIPPPQVLSEWMKDDRDGFLSYRKDFADLLEIAYPVLKSGLFAELVRHALNQFGTAHPDWQEVESCLFCINSLSDSLAHDQTEYASLSALFQSPLFSVLAGPEANEFYRTKLTAISVIGSYSDYFEEHTDLLPGALNFLFSSLTNGKLINQASKSIHSLCSSCRSKLVTELPAFLQHYQIFATAHPSESFGREKVLGGLGCLIQALSREEDKINALQPLLASISEDFVASKQLASHGLEEEAKDRAALALRCLVSLGKALQAPDDGPIVLDDSIIPANPVAQAAWTSGIGQELQVGLAVAIEDISRTFLNDREISKDACDVFRCGFTEQTPGLLVFPPRIVVDFLLHCGARSPFYDIVIGTASAFINCISPAGYDECRKLTAWVFSLLERLESPEADPELAHNILEYATRLLSKHVSLFLEVNEMILSRVFNMALLSIVCKEQFPKKTACAFWTTLIANSAQDEEYNMLQTIIQRTGPLLAKNLVSATGGGASRSELDTLSEPLKKLVYKQLNSKQWLQAGLFSNGDSFPSPKVTESDKNKFLSKLFVLRGGRGTNQLVKEFWLACRGSEFSYAS